MTGIDNDRATRCKSNGDAMRRRNERLASAITPRDATHASRRMSNDTTVSGANHCT
jgi:hypothetical protein